MAARRNRQFLRKFIGSAQQRAQQSGNFDLADNLGRLRSAINRTIEEAPGYADAKANYQRFAERFRPEPNDAMSKLTRAIDRGGQNADGELNRVRRRRVRQRIGSLLPPKAPPRCRARCKVRLR